jgi:thiol-disulfide isomerase/thioredoxin
MRQMFVSLGLLVLLCGGASMTTAKAAHIEELLEQIEAQARDLTEHGARSEAVYSLQRALETYRESALRWRIEADIRLFSLEGRPALPLQTGMHIGARVPGTRELDGKVVLLFFWAHWCADCKAESTTVEALLEKYRARDFVLIAPTQRYGSIAEGRPAAPDKELRYIMQVRDTYYRFMREVAVPVSEANYKQYGVASIPMHVLIDRKGIIRLYQPGRISAEQLDAAIRNLL